MTRISLKCACEMTINIGLRHETVYDDAISLPIASSWTARQARRPDMSVQKGARRVALRLLVMRQPQAERHSCWAEIIWRSDFCYIFIFNPFVA